MAGAELEVEIDRIGGPSKTAEPTFEAWNTETFRQCTCVTCHD